MFPPEDVVPEPEFRGIHHLPATAVRSVVEQVFALPIMVSYDLRQESRESELSSGNFDLILTDDDPDLRLNPQLWPAFEVRIAPERPEFASSGQLLVNAATDVVEGDEFLHLLRETGDRGWFLDRTFKDFTTGRAAGFMVFLSEGAT